MSLDHVLDSIAAGLGTAVPVLKVCEVVGGNVDVAEVLRRSRHLPAAFVFCHGTEDAKVYQDKVKTRGMFAVVLVVKSAAEAPPTKNDRTHVAARIAGRILYAITTAGNWSDDEVDGAPINVDSRNRYTTAADAKDVALWAFSWEQMLALVKDPADPELDDLEKIVATYELQDGTTPAVDAVDEINFP